MLLPQNLNIRTLDIPVYGLFVFISLLVFIYFFWSEAKKEGFDQEKIFDIMFIVLLSLLAVLKVDILVVISAEILGVYTIVHFWKWSVYRIMDIFSLSVYAASLPVLLGMVFVYDRDDFLISIPLVFAVLFYLKRKRNIILKSGYVFSILLIASAGISAIYFRETSYLIFYVFLIIISMVNYILREKKSMSKTNFSLDFIKNIKNILVKKEKRLTEEQKLLLEEDPYNDRGRDTDNAELMDDALLEDNRKEVVDLRASALTKVQIQVRRALAKIRIGTYGLCEVCGIPIDKARLEAYPEATTCFEHATHANE